VTVTAEQVRGHISNLPSDFDFVQIFLTTKIIREEYLDVTLLSAPQLDYIELLLACHFTVLNVERGGLIKQTIGDASETYHDTSNKLTGLNSTRFGTQAIAFDTTGALADLSTGMARAEFRVY
jgi:hypothetical protein